MALVVADRVKETSTTTGTGAFTLDGAVTGYQAFSVIGNGNTTYYAIVGQTGSEWEVGLGTYTSSGTSLSRDTILSSSNGGTIVTFSAGTKDVFVTYPAGRSVYQDTAGLVALSGTLQAGTLIGGSASITNAHIGSALIDIITNNTFTGGSGSITTLTGSSINFTTIRATTFEGGSASITNADINSALIGIITNTTFTGGSASITTLTGSSAGITTISSTTFTGGSASITTITGASAQITLISTPTFHAGSASITNADIASIVIGSGTVFGELNFQGSSSSISSKFWNAAENVTNNTTGAGGTINYDVTTQSVLRYAGAASSNFTVNIRGNAGVQLNALMANSECITLTMIATQTGTAFFNASIAIDTTATVTREWQGGAAPTAGNANSDDVYVYSVIKTASSTFTVYASQTRYA